LIIYRVNNQKHTSEKQNIKSKKKEKKEKRKNETIKFVIE